MIVLLWLVRQIVAWLASAVEDVEYAGLVMAR